MPKIHPLEGPPFSFIEAVAVLEALIERAVIVGPRSSAGFQAEVADLPEYTFDVTGRGFSYGEVFGIETIESGTIEEVTFSIDGERTIRYTEVDLRISDALDAVEDRFIDGDLSAVADLLLELDYDYRGSGLDEVWPLGEGFDTAGDDVFVLGDGRHEFDAGSGDDRLVGGPLADRLEGGPGDDMIRGGRGGDTIRGGPGEDVAELDALLGGGSDLIRTDAVGGDAVYALDRADGGHDTITGVERFTDGAQSVALSEVPRFDALAYAASHPDLAQAFGTDEGALLRHYLEEGFAEGRTITFEAGQYLANYADLRAAFGDDEAAATRHYLASGREAGRLAADPLEYIASFSDLSAAFGDLSADAVRAAGMRHHQRSGADEGRTTGIDFDAGAYLANYADLRAAFGGNEDAAALHYIRSGQEAGRLAEDALVYLASFDDLINVANDRGLQTEAQLRAFATTHFRRFGEAAGRDERIDFDADAYMSNYGDLRDAFADGEGGYDEEAATIHWVLSGFEAGRTDELIPT